MPSVAINDLDIRGNDLVAATRGPIDLDARRHLAAAADECSDEWRPARVVQAGGRDAAAHAADPTAPPAGLYVDYYLGAGDRRGDDSTSLDASRPRRARVRRARRPTPPIAGSPVERPLATTAGHHRVAWNLRVDPPPSPHHRFARLAPHALRERSGRSRRPARAAGHLPRAADGRRPSVHAAARRSRRPVAAGCDRRRRAAAVRLAMKTYDAMQVAHRAFLQLARSARRLKPLLVVAGPGFRGAGHADLDTRAGRYRRQRLDGPGDSRRRRRGGTGRMRRRKGSTRTSCRRSRSRSARTTTIRRRSSGRAFNNVDHAPAFAILGTSSAIC